MDWSREIANCIHPRLTKKQVKAKEWLSPKSETFETLQNIVLYKKVLEDLSYLTNFFIRDFLKFTILCTINEFPKDNIFCTLVC